MTNREANIRAATKLILLLVAVGICTAVMSRWGENLFAALLATLGRWMSAHPLAFLLGISVSAIAVVSRLLASDRPRPLNVLDFSDWHRLYFGEWLTRQNAFEWHRHRMLRDPGYRGSMLKQSRLTQSQHARLDQWEEKRKKREAEMIDRRMVDLPGYKR